MASPRITVIVAGDSSQMRASIAAAEASLGKLDAAAQASATKMQALSARMTTLGAGMSRAGSAMTRGITLPIGVAGVAAGKLAYDFNKAFTRISAVSNASQKSIRQWRSGVLDLAGKTAQAPNELADALYFLASAGLKTNQVMPTLAASAKASAVGLGETKDIAKLTAQAMNAYSKEGLSAAQVTDTLVAAVKAGTADPEEFAGALGRILPVAQNAGIGFDQVTASLAQLSNAGLDVNEGVTSMRSAILSLSSPTDQAKETLAKMGLTASEVRDSLAKNGLIATYRDLNDRAVELTGSQRDAIDPLRKVFGNVRGLAGVMNLTGQRTKAVNKTFKDVKNSTGELDKSLDKTRKGSAFKFEQGLADLQAAAIELGNKIIPIGEKIVHFVSGAAKWFSKLSDEQQNNIIKWALIAAAAGPVLRIFGGMTSALGTMIKLGPAAARAMGLVAASGTGAGAAGTAAGGAAAGGGAVAGGATALGTLGVAALGVGAFKGIHAAGAKTIDWAKQFRSSESLVEKAFGRIEEAGGSLAQSLGDHFGNIGTMASDAGGTIAGGLLHQLAVWGGIADDDKKKTKELTRSLHGLALESDAGTKATKDQARQLHTVANALLGFGGRLTETRRAQLQNLIASGDFTGALKLLKGWLDDTADGMGKTKGKLDNLSGATDVSTLKTDKNTRAHKDQVKALQGLRPWLSITAGKLDNLSGSEDVDKTKTDAATRAHKALTQGLKDSLTPAQAAAKYQRELAGDTEKTGKQAETTKDKWARSIGSMVSSSKRGFGDIFTAHEAMAEGIQKGASNVRDAVGLGKLSIKTVQGHQLDILSRNTGGPIPGQGSRDTVPAMLTPGEHVWTKDEVQKVGGHGAMEVLRGMVQKFAKGGSVRELIYPATGDPDHQDHLHLAMSTHPAAIAMARAISRLRGGMFDVTELRGWHGQGQISSGHSPGSLHYGVGLAEDVNSAPGESSAEKSALNWLATWIRGNAGAFPGGMGVDPKKVVEKAFAKVPVPMYRGALHGTGPKEIRGAASKMFEVAKQEAAKMSMGSDLGANVSGSAVQIGKKMAAARGWTGSQWDALKALWNRESGWRVDADNPTSSAFGIPQALPGSKMASAGADWRTNPQTQIAWGLNYIAQSYGSPAGAWAHSQASGWYGEGGSFIANGRQTIGVGENGPEQVDITPIRHNRPASQDRQQKVQVELRLRDGLADLIEVVAIDVTENMVGEQAAYHARRARVA